MAGCIVHGAETAGSGWWFTNRCVRPEYPSERGTGIAIPTHNTVRAKPTEGASREISGGSPRAWEGSGERVSLNPRFFQAEIDPPMAPIMRNRQRWAELLEEGRGGDPLAIRLSPTRLGQFLDRFLPH